MRNPNIVFSLIPIAVSLTLAGCVSNPRATPAPQSSYNVPEGLPVFQIAENDNAEVTVAAVDGVVVNPTVLGRLRSVIAEKIEDKKMENPPTGLAKQFLVVVSLKKFGPANPAVPGLRALELLVDVRILPGRERVCCFGVGELGGAEMTENTLAMKAANDTVKCISDPRMWIRPETAPAPAPPETPLGRQRIDNNAT